MTTNTPTNILDARDQVAGGTEQSSSKSDILTRTKAALAMGALAFSVAGIAVAQESAKQNTAPEVDREIPGAIVTITFRTPTSPSPSAPLQVTKGYGQIVDTPFGQFSFAEIQKHEKKDEILAQLKPSKQARFNEWEQETAIETNKGKLEVQQVAINRGIALDTEIITKLELIAKLGKPLSQSDKIYLEKVVQSKTPPVDRLALSLLKTARFA